MNEPERMQAIKLLETLDTTIDPIAFSIAYRKKFDVRIDWHEFAYLLDVLRQETRMIRIGEGNDRMPTYKLAQ